VIAATVAGQRPCVICKQIQQHQNLMSVGKYIVTKQHSRLRQSRLCAPTVLNTLVNTLVKIGAGVMKVGLTLCSMPCHTPGG
jgi:hypothetical protein